MYKVEFSSVGNDVFIDERAYFKRPDLVTIGDHCAFDNGLHMTTAGTFGSYIHIGPFVSVIGGAESKLLMGNFASIAAGARIICKGEEHLGAGLIGPTIPDQYSDVLIGGLVVIKQFANILTNSVLFPGITIGEGAVIGAGTVMHFDAEPWTIYLGNPARKIKVRDGSLMKRYGEELIGAST